MTSKKKSSAGNGASPGEIHVQHNEIALGAYHIFLQRGGIHGYGLDDWLQAECKVLQGDKKKPLRSKKSKLVN